MLCTVNVMLGISAYCVVLVADYEYDGRPVDHTITRLQLYKCLFASDIKMCTGICLGDVSFITLPEQTDTIVQLHELAIHVYKS